MRRVAVAGAAALSVASVVALSRAETAAPPAVPVTAAAVAAVAAAWEYHVVPAANVVRPPVSPEEERQAQNAPLSLARRDPRKETEDALNHFGAHGWELCGVVGGDRLVFKRPKP